MCYKCGFSWPEFTPPLGHSWTDQAAVAATCTTAGHSAYQQCSRCGEKQNYTEIPATGHTVENNVCTTCGKYGYCGTTSHESEVTWEVTGDAPAYTLTISGTGAMANCTSSDPAPWAAFKSDLTTAVIGDGVTSIGKNAFYSYTALTSVTIASSVTTIGMSAFKGCTSLANIDGASGVTFIEPYALNETAWRINLPDGMNCVGHVAYRFKGDATSATITDGTTQINENCFLNSKITSIVIPASVTSIGDMAFKGCTDLSKVYVLRYGASDNEITSLGSDAFENCTKLTAIIVPADAYEYYDYDDKWHAYQKLRRGYTVTGTNITATSYAPIVAEGETVTLSYTGEVPTGCEVRYSLDGGTTLLVGNTFQMPAANVTVTAVMNGPDQPFVVTTWDDLLSKMAVGGYIRLDADVDPSNSSGNYLTVPQNVTVTLDLNDHTIDQKSENATKEFGIFIIAGALTLNDSGTGGTITGGKAHATNGGTYYTYGFGGCVFVAPTGTFTMNGGTISGNTTDNGGGGVYVANSDKPRSTHEPSWNGTNDYDMKLGTTASIDLKRHISGFPSPYVNIKSTTDPTGSDIDPSTYTLDDDIFTFTPKDKGTYDFVFSAAGYNTSYPNVQIVVDYDDPNNSPTEPAAVTGGTFTMNGGTISGNRAGYDGGGVYVEDGCTFTMNGGTISGNTANNDGGGVYANWGATVNLNGGTITGNTASNVYGRGGGVMLKGGMVTVSGSPVISGNTKSGRPNNLEVADSHYLRIGTLTSGANIGITTMTIPTTAAPVTFTKNAKDGDLQYFFCDRTGYALGTNADGQLTVNDPNVATTPWAALQAALNAGGTVTLTEDVTQTDYDVNNEMAELNISGTVTLDLAGHTITGIGDYVIKIGTHGHLTLTDSGTGGTITGGQSGVYISADNSSFTMTGGTITGNHGNSGGVYVSNGTFSVSGKVVITGNTDNSGNAKNLYLTTGKVINVTGPLSPDTRIGVTTKKAPKSGTNVTFAQGSNYTPTIGDVSRFSSDNSTYYVAMNANNEAYLTIDNTDANIIVELSETQTDMPTLAEGTKVAFRREFKENVSSTVCLPFSIDATQAAAAGKFYTFVGVDKTDPDDWEVIMQETPTSNLVEGALAANTPYLFKPAATGPVLFHGTAAASSTAGATSDTEGWTFTGTYERIDWTTDPQTIYGFAAQSYNGGSYTVSPGDFVKAASGASIAPFRAYLQFTAGNTNAPRRGAAENDALPSRMTVRLVNADGETTSLSEELRMKSEEFATATGWYTLDGRKLDKQPTQKGLYIVNGKKVFVTK